MTKEEYKKILDDTETSLAVCKASKSHHELSDVLAMLDLGLKIAKEKYKLDMDGDTDA